MQVIKRDGSRENVDKSKIEKAITRLAEGLTDIDLGEVAQKAYESLYDGISTDDIDRAMILAARSQIIYEPNYGYLASRLLLNCIYREVFGGKVKGETLVQDYRRAFVENIRKGIDLKVFDARLGNFNLELLAEAIQPERDLLFKYLGTQTLYDRYLANYDGKRIETPQAFWMRVAMGLCLNERDYHTTAIECYNQLSQQNFCSSTPTLFNSGTPHSQLSSCYISTVEDSLNGFLDMYRQQARLSKYAGGLGVDLTPMRSTNSSIRNKSGKSVGVIPWAKQLDSMAACVNQSGKRKGACAIYLESWHLDFPEFLDLRKNTGDEGRRTRNINPASWIPCLFMKKVKNNEDWYLFSPSDFPELHEVFGRDFDREYNRAIRMAESGKIKHFEKMPAKALFKKMLGALKESGHPWLTWKDGCNIRYANQHLGVVHSSNLCTEITEHNKPNKVDEHAQIVELGEVANCNLASVNLANHLTESLEVDWDKLTETVKFAVRMLDNVIGNNFYPVPEAANSNFKYRPVGLGIMGWQDMLQMMKLPFESAEALSLAFYIEEFITYKAIEASVELAEERGAYPSFQGSSWSKGIMPYDTYLELIEYREGEKFEFQPKMDWDDLREKVMRSGMRNGLLRAIAPTATISSISGVYACHEPNPSLLYVYSTLSGSVAILNEHFVRDMKKMGVWSREFAQNILKVDGETGKLVLPTPVKELYKTAFEIDQIKLAEQAAARQVWIDQAVSTNFFYSGNSMKYMSDFYFRFWSLGAKTSYYLHSGAASKIEKSVKHETQETVQDGSQCHIGGLMESCESCQ